SGENCIDVGISRQVAVGTACIAVITQANADRQIGANLPAVTEVPGEAIVRSEAAGGEPECGIECVEAEAVTVAHAFGRIVKRIRRSARIEPGVGEVDGVLRLMPGDAWSFAVEVGEPATLDVVERNAITQDVRMQRFAAVVLDLMVGLRSGLRSERARSDVQA